MHLVFHPFLRQSSTREDYFALFFSCTSSILSSQATVGSKRMSCLVASEIKMVSGLGEVRMICAGIFSCLSRSTAITQSQAVKSNLPEALFSYFLRPLSLLNKRDCPGCCMDVSALKQLSRSAVVALMESVSFRLHLKTFPRIFTGCSVTDGICSSPNLKWN